MSTDGLGVYAKHHAILTLCIEDLESQNVKLVAEAVFWKKNAPLNRRLQAIAKVLALIDDPKQERAHLLLKLVEEDPNATPSNLHHVKYVRVFPVLPERGMAIMACVEERTKSGSAAAAAAATFSDTALVGLLSLPSVTARIKKCYETRLKYYYTLYHYNLYWKKYVGAVSSSMSSPPAFPFLTKK